MDYFYQDSFDNMDFDAGVGSSRSTAYVPDFGHDIYKQPEFYLDHMMHDLSPIPERTEPPSSHRGLRRRKGSMQLNEQVTPTQKPSRHIRDNECHGISGAHRANRGEVSNVDDSNNYNYNSNSQVSTTSNKTKQEEVIPHDSPIPSPTLLSEVPTHEIPEEVKSILGNRRIFLDRKTQSMLFIATTTTTAPHTVEVRPVSAPAVLKIQMPGPKAKSVAYMVSDHMLPAINVMRNTDAQNPDDLSQVILLCRFFNVKMSSVAAALEARRAVVPSREQDVYYRCHPFTYAEDFRRFAVPRLEYSALPENYPRVEEFTGPSPVFQELLKDYISVSGSDDDFANGISSSEMLELSHGTVDNMVNRLLRTPTSYERLYTQYLERPASSNSKDPEHDTSSGSFTPDSPIPDSVIVPIRQSQVKLNYAQLRRAGFAAKERRMRHSPESLQGSISECSEENTPGSPLDLSGLDGGSQGHRYSGERVFTITSKDVEDYKSNPKYGDMNGVPRETVLLQIQQRSDAARRLGAEIESVQASIKEMEAAVEKARALRDEVAASVLFIHQARERLEEKHRKKVQGAIETSLRDMTELCDHRVKVKEEAEEQLKEVKKELEGLCEEVAVLCRDVGAESPEGVASMATKLAEEERQVS